MTGNKARKMFIEYFKKHNHQKVRSSSLVPQDDPSLLFVNAGMVQFKRVFTGDEKRDYTMAVTAQKCVRAGGKHNDLENVGYTARHHTFFEMLGNFSFGDYFKEKSIVFAWDLLINGYGFDKKKLWISVYQDDDEAYELWRDKIKVNEKRIVRLGKDSNFWAMGDTGPCGPCSEIHIDRGEEFGCDDPNCAVGCDCDRYLELWNLVFMQYEKDEKGNMISLPKPSIDTGLGLERVISVLQNVPTNYETDLFIPIIEKIEELSGRKKEESKINEIAMKVIADHSRATAFLICDGVLPSNEGRGYVLRRIMRRAIRYGRNIGLRKPFFDKAVEKVFDIMDYAYPELKSSGSFIINVVKNEEAKFFETLDIGLKLLNETIKDMEKQKEKEIAGNVIFKLYDTFGFPLDIISDVVKDSDITLDIDGYNKAMEEQRKRSKKLKTFEGVGDALKNLTSNGIKTDFIGYDVFETKSKVLLLIKNDKEIDKAHKNDEIQIITKQTPFYAESGGQTGDTGIIKGIENLDLKIKINNTLIDPSGIIIHNGKLESGTLKKGDKVFLQIHKTKRENICLNHTATHILHTGLRNVLGDHVKQSGSLVTNKRLRFDFIHFSAIEKKDIEKIEKNVNKIIRANYNVNTFEMSMDKAVESGATALFEEKYGDKVRVVSIDKISKELCGGTHTTQTGNIGLFKIVSETGIAAGVRRIEALTGENALEYIHNNITQLQNIADILKTSKNLAFKKVQDLLTENKSMNKKVLSLKEKAASKSVKHIDDEIKEINGVKILCKKVEIDNPSQLRDLADKFKTKIQSGIILLGAESNKKVFLISIVTKDLTDRFQADNIVKKAALVVGGGGGGRSDMAQAGGSKPENLDKALKTVFDI
ncbi:MAG: alanine--tRNA ligase [Desulfobacteraceae bacterium 4572_130]|nr:MAG: alanine--tRNA ligase [Desulfobacteraceae bacterium 4572_130]